MSEYDIRHYRPDDRDGFLSLYRTVMDREKQEDWFSWKYQGNPYTDNVPMIVGVADGEIVGARPFFALPVSIDGDREIGLQPGDTMVPPEHRRQGLFTRMTERAIERYAENHPFFFNFPNDQSRPGYLTRGWEVVSERSSWYRIERPENIAKSRGSQSIVQLLSKLGTPIARGYYALRDRTTATDSGITVRTESELPAEELTTLYRTSIPAEIHALRDEEFYQWRFRNPDWEYTTYIAERGTDPVAAIVTGSSSGPVSTTKLTDVVPLRSAPRPALVSLISRILTDHSETDLFVAPPQGFPESVLRNFGFHTDTTVPLSFLSSQTTHVVRTLTDSWRQNDRDITASENWLLTFVEEDTS